MGVVGDKLRGGLPAAEDCSKCPGRMLEVAETSSIIGCASSQTNGGRVLHLHPNIQAQELGYVPHTSNAGGGNCPHGGICALMEAGTHLIPCAWKA